MKAIAYTQSLPITDPQSLQDVELDQPVASGNDLLIKVQAIGVNPVDYKIRQWIDPEGENKVLGWDAVGEVVAAGEAVKRFKPGDSVYYAGDLNRQGGNAEYQLVDEDLAGHKPKSLSNAEAAALPLTSITAWELLFEHLSLQQQTAGQTTKSDEVLLVTGAAGGVGSILIQIAKVVTGATVIATASRESSKQWVTELGADHVIDHSQPMPEQLAALGIDAITHVASLNGTEAYYESYIEMLAPFGKIAMIDDPSEPLDPSKLKMKSLSMHYEFMFARSMFNAKDKVEQSKLLNRVAELVDAGHIKTTIAKHLGTINADHLKLAHEILETSQAIGKIVLEDF